MSAVNNGNSKDFYNELSPLPKQTIPLPSSPAQLGGFHEWPANNPLNQSPEKERKLSEKTTKLTQEEANKKKESVAAQNVLLSFVF